MRLGRVAVWLCASLALVPAEVRGEEAGLPFVVELGVSTGRISTAGVDSSGVGSPDFGAWLGLSAHPYRYLSVSLGGGLSGGSDKRRFSQNTTGGTFGASLLVWSGSLSVGVLTPPIRLGSSPDGFAFATGVNVGVESVGGSRSVDNCSDCRVDHVSLSAGPFLEPVAQLYFWNQQDLHLGMGLSYRFFRSGADLQQQALVTFLFGKL
jgi:hypothetical protein